MEKIRAPSGHAKIHSEHVLIRNIRTTANIVIARDAHPEILQTTNFCRVHIHATYPYLTLYLIV